IWIGEDSDNNILVDIWEIELEEMFCPKVIMHLHNPMIPTPVEFLLDDTALMQKFSTSHVVHWDTDSSTRTVQEAFEFYKNSWNKHWFLDLGGTNSNRTPSYWASYYNSRKNNYSTPTTYAHCFRDQGSCVIQYWFYYPYNDWAGDHEGDWEHINVKLSSANPDVAEMVEVVYYFHEKRKTLSVSQISKDGNHPYVYVGGSQNAFTCSGSTSGGSYYRVGTLTNVIKITGLGGPSDVDENIVGTRVIQPAEFNIVHMASVCNLWWMKFPGEWGVPPSLISDSDVITNHAPVSPFHHDCWEEYEADGKANYNRW
ncbi:hypothetical protein KAR48_12860, partial [bacterium]|nr:hypothetical protein [bacterium]